MKKIILLALTALMMVGCNYQNPDGSYKTSKSGALETVVIDSCEYVYGYSKLAHKGNCRFCKERKQQELKELAEKELASAHGYRARHLREIIKACEGWDVDEVVVEPN